MKKEERKNIFDLTHISNIHKRESHAVKRANASFTFARSNKIQNNKNIQWRKKYFSLNSIAHFTLRQYCDLLCLDSPPTQDQFCFHFSLSCVIVAVAVVAVIVDIQSNWQWRRRRRKILTTLRHFLLCTAGL
jgi:hypothetical protein